MGRWVGGKKCCIARIEASHGVFLNLGREFEFSVGGTGDLHGQSNAGGGLLWPALSSEPAGGPRTGNQKEAWRRACRHPTALARRREILPSHYVNALSWRGRWTLMDQEVGILSGDKATGSDQIGQRAAPLTCEVREDNLASKEFRVHTHGVSSTRGGGGIGVRGLRFQRDMVCPRAEQRLAARGCGTPDISLGSEERLN